MKYAPHDYQRHAIRFVEGHPASAIFLDMGLGKTSIALTAAADLLFDSFEVSRVLVVAPLRVARDTWPAEIAKWDHLSHLTWALAVGTAAERRAALAERADVTIINRENVAWLVHDSGAPFDFDMVVIDELSSFKSHQSKRFRALARVRPRVRRIVGLTGTPSSNGLIDLWAQFRLLDMGERLGRLVGEYRRRYFEPDRTNGQVVYSWRPQSGAEEAIYARISDITISMRAADHLDMPELVMNRVEVEMDAGEWAAYRRMGAALALSLGDAEVTAANAAALTGKLLQMANGAVYGDDGEVLALHDRKLDALEDIVEAACGRPVLVAYWFRHDLERMRGRLRVRELRSAADVRDWNEGRVPVAAIHPASAGHGLNLQAGGSTLVWFGLTWSLELYQQTNARLWRQGQADRTVVIHHILCRGTVDEDVMAALAAKDATQAALIDAVRARIGNED